MSKSGTHQPPPLRSSGTRSYWVKSAQGPTAEKVSSDATDGPPAKRFLEPFRLEEQQRDSLLQTLKRLRLGDAPSRELFLAAVEYALATYKQQKTTEPSPPEPRQTPALADAKSLTPLAAAIRTLCERIDALDEPARSRLLQDLTDGDRFQRSYDTRYLSELRCELDLLSQACAVMPAAGPGAHSTGLTPSGRQLVSRVADTYADCFETKPTAEPDGPFAQILAHLLRVASIDLVADEVTLKQMLNAG